MAPLLSEREPFSHKLKKRLLILTVSLALHFFLFLLFCLLKTNLEKDMRLELWREPDYIAVDNLAAVFKEPLTPQAKDKTSPPAQKPPVNKAAEPVIKPARKAVRPFDLAPVRSVKARGPVLLKPGAIVVPPAPRTGIVAKAPAAERDLSFPHIEPDRGRLSKEVAYAGGKESAALPDSRPEPRRLPLLPRPERRYKGFSPSRDMPSAGSFSAAASVVVPAPQLASPGKNPYLRERLKEEKAFPPAYAALSAGPSKSIAEKSAPYRDLPAVRRSAGELSPRGGQLRVEKEKRAAPVLPTHASREIAPAAFRPMAGSKDILPVLEAFAKKGGFRGKKTWTSHINDTLLNVGGIKTIAMEKGGDKWLGTEKGLLHYKNGRWRSYTVSNGLGGNVVYAIAIDKRGGKWLGTNRGVSFFDGAVWRNYGEEDGLAGVPVYGLAVDRAGVVWCATEQGVSSFDGSRWLNYSVKNGLSHNQVYAVVMDGGGKKWFATAAGLDSFDGRRWKNYNSANSGLLSDLIYALAVDGGDNLWIGTDKGVSSFNGRKWRNYTQENGLAGNRVYAIGVNEFGEKWFGTDNGVSRFDDLSWKRYGPRNGLTSRYVFAIANDGGGNQWFGTDNGVTELSYQLP